MLSFTVALCLLVVAASVILVLLITGDPYDW